MTEDCLRINPRNIAAETIDGEVVIVHFANANYYALNGLAADIWQWLVNGHRVTSILQHVKSAHPNADIETVRDFVATILGENLLEPCEPQADTDRPLPALAPDRKFAPPHIEKHEDMQKLILAGPDP